MSESERRFQPEIITHQSSIKSIATVESTAIGMDLYFSEQLTNPDPLRTFLLRDTLSFLRNAEQGFIRNPRMIDRLGLLSDRDYQILIREIDPNFGDHKEETEAISTALVLFGYMPNLPHYLLPLGYSRRGIHAPPSTTMEYNARLREIKTQVVRIINGQTKPDDYMEANPALWRTICFFEAGKVIPFKMPASEQSQLKERQEKFNSLVDGVDFGGF